MTTRDAHTSDVLGIVATARRRVRTVATLRLIAVAAPAGVTAGAALVLAGWAPAETPPVLGVLGAIAAAAWAAAHTPSRAAVARMIDARLGLRDRVAAAVQLQATGGPIAALVTRDAASRLASIRMREVFPLALGRPHAAAIAVAAASIAWLASGPIASSGPAAPAGSATSETAGGESSARATTRSQATSANSAGRSSVSTDAPQRQEPHAGNRPGNAAREAFAPTGTTTAPQQLQPPATTTPGASVNASVPAGRAAAAPAVASASGRMGRGGAGAGEIARGAVTAGAGGASPGSALASAPGADAAPAATVSYRAARTSAESALARDVIPPDYRDHVRAYFRALPASTTGPGGTR